MSRLILVDTAPAFNYFEDIVEHARRHGATDEMLNVLQADWPTDDVMRQNVPIVWPLYFKNFDPDIGPRVVEKSIMSVAGQAYDGELAA